MKITTPGPASNLGPATAITDEAPRPWVEFSTHIAEIPSLRAPGPACRLPLFVTTEWYR